MSSNKKESPYKHKVLLTEKEYAFIQFCRRVGHATIANLGIVKGEPTTFVNPLERMDLSKPEDLAKAMGRSAPAPVEE